MAGTPERLAAEILVDDERGSGLLIAKGLVLTALHTLLGDQPSKRVERPLTAKVRFQGDVQDAADRLPPLRDSEASARRLQELGLPWHEAKLVWPLTEELAEAYDLALLRLDNPDSTALEPMDFVRAHVPQSRPIGCVSHGYPSFSMESFEVGDIWELRRVDGELEPTPRRSDRTRLITVHSAPPADVDGWQGLSGAAVWIDDEQRVELVGIVEARTDGLALNNMIRCLPVGRIEDESFWRLSGIKRAIGAKADSTSKPLSALLGDNFFRFDRRRATSNLRAWLKGDPPGEPPALLRSGPPARPSILLLRGHLYDEPALCAQRFAELLAEEVYSGQSGAYRTPITLSCGFADDPAPMRFDDLLRDWAKSYGKPGGLDTDFRQIVLDGLAEPDRSRIVVIEHRDSCFTENCRKVVQGVAGLLESWAPADPNRPFPPVVILSVMTGQDVGPRDSAYRPLAAFSAKEEAMIAHLEKLRAATAESDGRPLVEWHLRLPPLSDPAAVPADVEAWLQDIARREAVRLPDTLPIDIKSELRRQDAFPVRFAKDAIEDAAARQGVQR